MIEYLLRYCQLVFLIALSFFSQNRIIFDDYVHKMGQERSSL